MNLATQEIGKGQCGTVFSLQGTDKVAKVPNSREKVEGLLQDYKMHHRIIAAMNDVDTSLRPDINVTDLGFWVATKNTQFWAQYGLMAPHRGLGADKPFALVSKRILPGPLTLREALVDGNDIEFILGISPMATPSPAEIESDDEYSLAERFRLDFRRTSLSIWLLDYNQCRVFDNEPAGLKQIVDAFMWNDPYYPVPDPTSQKDQKLWEVFKTHYLYGSRVFTQSEWPTRFVEKIEEFGKKGSVK